MHLKAVFLSRQRTKLILLGLIGIALHGHAMTGVKASLAEEMPQNARVETIKQPPRALIFVSFSMPQLLFEQTLKSAARYHIPVVLNGLYKDSFPETYKKLFNLFKQHQRLGLLIDPLWFNKFHIRAVPALVVQGEQDTTAGLEAERQSSWDVVYGNVRVGRALEIISEQGDQAKTAKTILKRSERHA